MASLTKTDDFNIHCCEKTMYDISDDAHTAKLIIADSWIVL